MKHLFVTFEIAKKLKEIGFDELGFAFYESDGEFKWNNGESGENEMNSTNWLAKNSPHIDYYAAPLWERVMDWLRTKRWIEIKITNYYEGSKEYKPEYQIFINGEQQYFQFSSASSVELYPTYAQARDVAITRVLENLTSKKK